MKILRVFSVWLAVLLVGLLLPGCATTQLPTPYPTEAPRAATATTHPSSAPPSPWTATATPAPTRAQLFFASEDPLIYADPEGRVLRLDLGSGETRPLSEPGVYLPGERLAPYPFDQPLAVWTPALSPDGRSLALPDPGGSGTWLIDLNGEVPACKLLEKPTAVSWSPDGMRLAWTDAEYLNVQAASCGEARRLAAIPGLLNVAWSPQGQTVAVAAALAESQQVAISLVDVESGAVTELIRVQHSASTGRGFDLAWTADGSEVWYAPAMTGFDVNQGIVRPLLSPLVFAGERQTMYLLGFTPDLQHFAAPPFVSEPATRSLVVYEEMWPGGHMEVSFERSLAGYAWTEDGHNLIVQEGHGEQANLWRINPYSEAQAYYLAAAEAGAPLAPGYLIGTRSHLAQYHRQVAPRIEPPEIQLVEPKIAEQWGRVPLAAARLSVEHPFHWNYNWPGMGDVASTLSNFDMTPGYYLLSLTPEWFYAHFDYLLPPQGSAQAFLEKAVFAAQANAEWQEISIDGRTAYRVRWKDRPTYEEVFVPFEDNVIIHIRKYPLESEQDAVFERMLQTAKWLPEDQWVLPITPTPASKPEGYLQYRPIAIADTLPEQVETENGLLVVRDEDAYIRYFNPPRVEALPSFGYSCMAASPDGRWISNCDWTDPTEIWLTIISVDRQQQIRALLDENLSDTGAYLWLNNEWLQFMVWPGDVGLRPMKMFNRLTQEWLELPSDYPDLYQDGSPHFDYTDVVYDPSLQFAVYPDVTRNPREVVLWDRQAKTAVTSIPIPSNSFEVPIWSQNGEHFALSVLADAVSSTDPEKYEQGIFDRYIEEWILVKRDGQVEQLTQFGTFFDTADIGSASWSPDGQKLAFWINLDKPSQCPGEQLAMWEVSTRQVTNLCIPGSVEVSPAPLWSLDGRFLALLSIVNFYTDEQYAQTLLVDLEQGWAARISETPYPFGWVVGGQ